MVETFVCQPRPAWRFVSAAPCSRQGWWRRGSALPQGRHFPRRCRNASRRQDRFLHNGRSSWVASLVPGRTRLMEHRSRATRSIVRRIMVTILYSDETLPEREVGKLPGHTNKLASSTAVYAKQSRTVVGAVRSLTALFREVRREARVSSADHNLATGLRSRWSRGHKIPLFQRDYGGRGRD